MASCCANQAADLPQAWCGPGGWTGATWMMQRDDTCDQRQRPAASTDPDPAASGANKGTARLGRGVADMWRTRGGVADMFSRLVGLLAPNLTAISADLGWVRGGTYDAPHDLQLLEAAVGRLIAFYGATGVPDTAKPLSACPSVLATRATGRTPLTVHY